MKDITKPFLKWVGGKTQIIKHIVKKFPTEMENYHEPFLGGGSVLLATLSLQRQNRIIIKGKIYAYDINPVLINVYKNVQSNPGELFKHVSKIVSEYDKITGDVIIKNPTDEQATSSKESYYYWMRNKFNNSDKQTVECSAMFIFLNKTCFRGMYREGPNGFNVPYGHYKKTPSIITRRELDNISDLIRDVEFIHSDFRDSIKRPQIGDFVYLDPPYAPETSTSFVSYTSGGFSEKTHKKLFKKIKRLQRRGIKFVMSNAKTDLVLKKFKHYTVEEIEARRAINAKKPGSKTTEVIIYNY